MKLTKQELVDRGFLSNDDKEKPAKVNEAVKACVSLGDPRSGDLKQQYEKDFKVACEAIEKDYRDSIKKCNADCERAANQCVGGDDNDEDTDSMVDVLFSGLGYNYSQSQNKLLICEMDAGDIKSKDTSLETRADNLEKDFNRLQEDSQKALTDYNTESKRVSEAQTILKDDLRKLSKSLKDDSRDATRKQMDLQTKVDEGIQQAHNKIAELRSSIYIQSQDLKRTLINYDINNIYRICKTKIFAVRAQQCKDNPEVCKKTVATGMGQAVLSGGAANADRNAEYQSCVDNMAIEYTQTIDRNTENIKKGQAQIAQIEEALAKQQDSQQKNLEILFAELEDMKNDKNEEMKSIGQKYQDLEKERIQAQQQYQTKSMEIRRQQSEINLKRTMAQNQMRQLRTRPRGLGKDVTGDQALSYLSEQASLRNKASSQGCCVSNSGGPSGAKAPLAGSPVCTDKTSKKLSEQLKKSGGSAK